AAHQPVRVLLPAPPSSAGAAGSAVERASEPPQSSAQAPPQAPEASTTGTPASSPGESPARSGSSASKGAAGEGGSSRRSGTPIATKSGLAALKHVFVIMLSSEPSAAV